jgi:hypothetical protein
MPHVTITRRQLYELIWERPLSKVAPELGTSFALLKAACKQHDIPVPEARYRGLVNAGRLALRTPLPELAEGQDGVLSIELSAVASQPREVATAVKAARSTPTLPKAKHRHALVAQTLAAARADEYSLDGAIRSRSPDLFRIRAHRSTLGDVGELLNQLVHTAMSRGYSFARGRDGLAMIIEGEPLDFSINQVVRKVPQPATSKLHYWEWQRRPEAFVPSGEMSLEIAGWGSAAAAPRRFVGREGRPLLARLDVIMVSFAAHGAGLKVRRDEDARRAELARAEQERIARQAQLEKHAKARAEFVMDKAQQLETRDRLQRLLATYGSSTSDTIAAFVAAVQAELSSLDSALAEATIAAEISASPSFASGAFSDDVT